MHKTRLVIIFTLITALFASTIAASAAPLMSAPTGLSVLQIKMTGEEFIVIQNNTDRDITDLDSYWLNVYNNVQPVTAGVSSSSQQLPTGSLKTGQLLLLSAEPRPTCGAAIAGDLSVSFADAGGFVQLSRTTQQASGALVETAGDFLSWSSMQNGIIQNVPSSSKNPRALFYRTSNGGSFAWQQADLDMTDGCQLNVVVAGGSGSSSAVTPLTLAATSPPATILGEVAANGEAAPVMSAANIGLMAPQLSELLPNPVGTGNDNTSEFIELYNPNSRPFDLSNFVLEAGTSRMRSFTFPAGTILDPASFKAFSPQDTKLSLSNTSGQVNLVDPKGAIISATPMYEKAKDGQAWAVAKGNWSFTTKPTPGAANIIAAPAAKQPATKKKKATTRTANKSQKLVGQDSASAVAGPIEAEEGTVTIHSWVLALVAVAALLYGAYEYRRDIANRLYKLSAKLGARRAHRSTTARPGSD